MNGNLAGFCHRFGKSRVGPHAILASSFVCFSNALKWTFRLSRGPGKTRAMKTTRTERTLEVATEVTADTTMKTSFHNTVFRRPVIYTEDTRQNALLL